MTQPEPEQTGRAGFSFLTCRNYENLTDACCFKPLGLGMTCYAAVENWQRLCREALSCSSRACLYTVTFLSVITQKAGRAGTLNPHFIDEKPRVRESERCGQGQAVLGLRDLIISPCFLYHSWLRSNSLLTTWEPKSLAKLGVRVGVMEAAGRKDSGEVG